MAMRLASAVFAVALALLAAGCGALQTGDLEEQKQVLETLRAYEWAVATYDGEAAMDLFTDDYEGWRGSGREGVGRMVEMMAQRNSSLELDLTQSVVAVDGDTATVEGVVGMTGRWEMRSTYVLARTEDGWKITDIQFQR
jgi:ketosteroid isomerase-like protein